MTILQLTDELFSCHRFMLEIEQPRFFFMEDILNNTVRTLVFLRTICEWSGCKFRLYFNDLFDPPRVWRIRALSMPPSLTGSARGDFMHPHIHLSVDMDKIIRTHGSSECSARPVRNDKSTVSWKWLAHQSLRWQMDCHVPGEPESS